MARNGRKPKLELVGTYEAAEILGVERSRIARWLKENSRGKPKIPEPVVRLACGPIWLKADIVRAKPEIEKRKAGAVAA
jgi:hypothetical protein